MNRASLDNIVNPPEPRKPPIRLNPLPWDAKTFFLSFFILDFVYSLTVILLAIMTYFYRPVDIIYTVIVMFSNAVLTFMIYQIYKGSANRGQILFNYFILKLVLSVLTLVWSLYELISLSRISLELIVNLSRILKFQFILYILIICYSFIYSVFSIFLIFVQYPERKIQEREKAINMKDQVNLEGIFKFIARTEKLNHQENIPFG